MATKKAAARNLSQSGIMRPDYTLIHPDVKPVTNNHGISKDYQRLVSDALWYAHYEVQLKSLAKDSIWFANKYLGKDATQVLKNLPDYSFSVVGKWAHVVHKGAVLSDEHLERLISEFQGLVELAEKYVPETTQEDPDTAPRAPVVSIQERMREQLVPLVSSLDQQLDQLIAGELGISQFDPYREIKAFQPEVKPGHAKQIRDHFQWDAVDAQQVLEWQDPEIREAFGHLRTAKSRRDFHAFINKIITACETVSSTGKAQRKTRKPKEQNKAKAVEKIKFCESVPELGLASINPVSVIGATTLWVYSTKYRKLGVFRALPDQTLNVRGTTILNFDPETSTQKTIRKPELLKGSNKLSRTKMDKLYSELKTTPTRLKGRVNEHTILISVFSQ